MDVIVISNRKGGAGKTTAAVNLAAEFTAAGRRTLVIDMDTQGHCAVGLGVSIRSDTRTIHSLFQANNTSLCSAVISTPLENLDLIPADPLFNHGKGNSSPYILKKALRESCFRDRYDIILIDTPPSFDTLLINALVAADNVLIPFVPHKLSYEGIKQLIRALYPIMIKDNPGLKILGFLPSMASDRIKFHIKMKGKIAEEFGTAKILPPIHNSIRLAEAFAAGKPVRCYAPKSRGAQDYRNAAIKIMEILAVHSS